MAEWIAFMEYAECRFLVTRFADDAAMVSTVFIGIDGLHRPVSKKPRVFETMIFADSIPALDEYQVRYETIEMARRGHNLAVQKVKEFRDDDPETMEFNVGEIPLESKDEFTATLQEMRQMIGRQW